MGKSVEFRRVSRRAALVLAVVSASVFYSISAPVNAQTMPKVGGARDVVERMRGMSMRMQATGWLTEREVRRRRITKELHDHGSAAIAALIEALGDADVQMRQNAALVLGNLGGGSPSEARPPLDIRPALSALIEATRDADPEVRAWAASAIATIGPHAEPAIPALLALLRDPWVGPRNTSCWALGRIGPAARAALPALREALNDPSDDVRRSAQDAIWRIEGK
jgi:HEAT repeat protein